MRSRPRVQILVSLFVACGVSGCGSATGNVSGTVTLKEKVVKGGNVTFVAEGKATIVADIKEDGTYEAAGVPAGEVKVCVDTSKMNPASLPKEFKYGPPKDAKAPEGFGGEGPNRDELARRYVAIPKKYANPATTDLTTKITGGKQTYNIELVP